MFSEFWKGIGGKLAERWLAALFSPVFVFWTGAVLAWLYGPGRRVVDPLGWIGAVNHWTAQVQGLPAVAQALLVLGPLLLVTISGLLLQQLSRPTLRFLEGYWPAFLAPVRELCRQRLSRKADKNTKRLRALAGRPLAELTAGEAAELSRRNEAYSVNVREAKCQVIALTCEDAGGS